MAQRRNSPDQSFLWLFLVIGAGAGAYLHLNGGPGLLVAWIVAIVGVWSEKRPLDPDNPPRTYVVARMMRTALCTPTKEWIVPTHMSWWMCVGLTMCASALPMNGSLEGIVDDFSSLAWTNPVCAWLLSTTAARIIHSFTPPIRLTRPSLPWLIVPIVSASAAALLTSHFLHVAAVSIGVALIVASLVWGALVVRPQRAEYAASQAAASRWQRVSEALFPKSRVPVVERHLDIGDVSVDVLMLDPLVGADGFIAQQSKMGNILGGAPVLIVHALSRDNDGEVIPNAVDQRRVYACILPRDFTTTLTRDMDEETLFLSLSIPLALSVDAYMQKPSPDKRMIPGLMTPLHHVDEVSAAPSLWRRFVSALAATFTATDETDTDNGTDDHHEESEPDSHDAFVDRVLGSPSRWLMRTHRASTDPWENEASSEASEPPDAGDEPTSEPSTEGIWAVSLVNSAAADQLSQMMWYGPSLHEWLTNSILADGRATGSLILGDLSGTTPLASGPYCDMITRYGGRGRAEEALPRFVERVRETDAWDTRWASIKNIGNLGPAAEWGTYKEADYMGAHLQQMGFVTRNGIPPSFFDGIDSQLAATLNGAPFAVVTGFPAQGRGPGSRHSQAVMVTWSATDVQHDPSVIIPKDMGIKSIYTSYRTNDFPEHWILAGIVSQAFTSVKLARPEVGEVRPLAIKKSRTQCWKIVVTLYGGVTFSQVRAKAQALKSHLGTQWLAVGEGPSSDSIVLVAGARFGSFALATRDDEQWLTNLAWQQTFEAAGIVSKTTGSLPRTLDVESMPANENVTRMTFELPPGISLEDVTKKKGAIEKAAGMAFTQWSNDPDNPRNIVALASVSNPLPDVVPYDMEWADSHPGLVGLGLGIDGTVISWDPQNDPHLMVVGTSGSGKALEENTPVLTTRGWIKNKDLRIGDILSDEEEHPTKVLSLTPWEYSPTWTLTFDDGSRVRTDARHLWKVTSGKRRTCPQNIALAQRAQYVAETVGHVGATMADIACLLGVTESDLTDFRYTWFPALSPTSAVGTVYDVDTVMGWLARNPTTVAGYELSVSHLANLDIAGLWLDEETLTRILTPISDPGAVRQILLLSGANSRLDVLWHITRLYFVDEIAQAFSVAMSRGFYYPSRVVTTREIADMSHMGVMSPSGWREVVSVTLSGRGRVRCVRVDSPHHTFLIEGRIPTHNSASVQGIIYGCLANGWDVVVADPNKAGVDFQPFAPWMQAFVTTKPHEGGRAETAGMLEAIYEEVQRRVSLNATYSASTFMEIPSENRPSRLVVILDEFNSLINVSRPTKPAPGAPPEALTSYADQLAEFQATSRIGTYAANIAAQARSAGVSLVLMGQQLKSKDLDVLPGAGGIRTNMTRVLLGSSTFGDKQGALRSPENAPDLGDHIPKGRGFFESTSVTSAVIIQFWYTHPPKDVYPRELAQRRGPTTHKLTWSVDKELTHPTVEGQILSTISHDLGVVNLDWGEVDLISDADSGDDVDEVDLISDADSGDDVDDGDEVDLISHGDDIDDVDDWYDGWEDLPPVRHDPAR